MIDIVGGVGLDKSLSSVELQSIRSRLLGEAAELDAHQEDGDRKGRMRRNAATSHLEVISSEAGEAYRHIVETCLRADEVEKSSFHDEDKDSIAIRLQRVMGSSLVKKLREMEESLKFESS